MHVQTYGFAVQTKEKVVQRIGKSAILQPKTNYKGSGITWYEDKLNTDKTRQKESQ